MNVGIIGASGYSGEVLVRLLLRHPAVNLKAITSRQHAGKSLESVMPAMRGLAPDAVFDPSEAEALAARDDIDLFFLALPHGAAASFARPLVDAGRRVIDLSADFRISDTAVYSEYYGAAHPDPELLPRASYVIPEWADGSWRERPLVAAPGCYPTSVLVPLLPLIQDGLVDTASVVVNSFSGVSGAGRKVAEDYLYCERTESAKAYGLVRHRHLAEIEEQMGLARKGPVVIQFTPHLAPMRRGIATTIVVPAAAGQTLESLEACWERTYRGRPFVQRLERGSTPDTKDVVGTNRIDMAATHDPRTGNFIITSAIDNLMKGASGQAVQIMNLWFDLPETEGLLL
ncbi:MAG: N-acetyl-gamma-glutamyl-phosphate reductase [Opitutaceae bacterium]